MKPKYLSILIGLAISAIWTYINRNVVSLAPASLTVLGPGFWFTRQFPLGWQFAWAEMFTVNVVVYSLAAFFCLKLFMKEN